MTSEKNKFDLVFVGDSYTQGYGLWYYYWCENKLYHCIDYQERYHEVGAVHSGFVDNKSPKSVTFPSVVILIYSIVFILAEPL